MSESFTDPQLNGRVVFDFAVTKGEVAAFIDSVIGRCYMVEKPQYVEVYDATDPGKHEDMMDITLYCQCSPEFRFILASTLDFVFRDHPMVQRDRWTIWAFEQPSDLIARLLYRLLRTDVVEGAPFRASSFDDIQGGYWLAHVDLEH